MSLTVPGYDQLCPDKSILKNNFSTMELIHQVRVGIVTTFDEFIFEVQSTFVRIFTQGPEKNTRAKNAE